MGKFKFLIKPLISLLGVIITIGIIYNLKEDIGETNNLADEYPKKVEELEQKIDQYIKETGALKPEPNPDYNPLMAKVDIDINFGEINDQNVGEVILEVEETLTDISLNINAEIWL